MVERLESAESNGRPNVDIEEQTTDDEGHIELEPGRRGVLLVAIDRKRDRSERRERLTGPPGDVLLIICYRDSTT